MLRSRGGDINPTSKTVNKTKEMFENSQQEDDQMYLANQVIELFQEIINKTVNLSFSLEQLCQNHRFRFQQVSNKMNPKKKSDKPNYLKSMPKQMRIFVETLKSLVL
jgi:hypothetical protein